MVFNVSYSFIEKNIHSPPLICLVHSIICAWKIAMNETKCACMELTISVESFTTAKVHLWKQNREKCNRENTVAHTDVHRCFGIE